MIKFETTNCNVEFCMEELKVKSKSEMFRMLYDCGMEISEISKNCESHYSFVYGVISASREVRKVKTTTKSDLIRELFDQGKTPGEISKELNSNYSFVFSVIKKYKSTKEQTEQTELTV